MKRVGLGIALLAGAVGWNAAGAATLFMGVYPDQLIVMDEAAGALTGKIKLETGLPTSIRLSHDRSKIFVNTITTSGIEVVDVATRKVLSRFSLNTPTTRYRFNGGAPDPTGRYYYTTLLQIDKGIDRYEVSKLRYAVIDLQEQKVVRTRDIDPEDERASANSFRTAMMVSEDGKYLYFFRDKVVVLNTADLTVVDRIDLAKAEATGMETATFGGALDTLAGPDEYVSLFTTSDPYIHNRVFGIGRFNLSSRTFDFQPIGPVPTAVVGLQVAPDRKKAYTVATIGTFGNKRCEFWRFDLATNTVEDRAEFQCRSRFNLGMSSDGQKLYIYGASYDLEVYDAATLKYERTWDLQHDITMAGMIAAR